MQKGRFITFEGLDGAGKSTHIAAMTELLRNHGKTVIATREPGGTPLAEKIRSLILNQEMDLASETLLMFAARQSHLSEVIVPALMRGEWVVCDRFTDATFAYQGGGRGVSLEKIQLLEDWVQGTLQPDLTILFDLPYEVAQNRVHKSRTPDRFELEKAEFHHKVRAAYLLRAQDSKGRIQVINAAEPIDVIRKKVEETIVAHCL